MRRTDVRERMVAAGQDLLSMRGYGPTTMLDVIERANAPRGSIYYYFKNGKEQLALEVLDKVAGELEHLVAVLADRKEEPVALLEALVDHHTKRLKASGFEEGCPIMGITVAMETDSAALKDAAGSAFERWIGAITQALMAKGLDAATSKRVASSLVSGVEGAIVVARATHDIQPLKLFRESVPRLLAA